MNSNESDPKIFNPQLSHQFAMFSF